MLAFKKRLKKGPPKQVAFFQKTLHKVGFKNVSGEWVPGLFHALFYGMDGEYYLQGNEDDAKLLIRKTAEVLHRMRNEGHRKLPENETLVQLVSLEEICEELRAELNGKT